MGGLVSSRLATRAGLSVAAPAHRQCRAARGSTEVDCGQPARRARLVRRERAEAGFCHGREGEERERKEAATKAEQNRKERKGKGKG